MQNQIANLRQQLKNKGKGKDKGGKGKGGKGQQGKWGQDWKNQPSIRMPTGFHNMLSNREKHEYKGEPICFGFNKGNCDKVRPGEKCDKGWHVCWKPGCERNHPFVGNHKA